MAPANPITIKKAVKEGLTGLEPNKFTNTAKDIKVTNPLASRCYFRGRRSSRCGLRD